MKIIQVHNYYQQPGGEDQVFAAESSMLEKHGHRVFRYTVHNDCITGMNSLELARCTVWNKAIARELRELTLKVRPDVIHFHNTFPLISPSAYYAAKTERIPVVQTLHNYRLLCPNALFFREDKVCEDCMGKLVTWPGVFHKCYRKSRLATSVTAAMLSMHNLLHTYKRMVDVYIVLADFARNKFIQGGLSSKKIVVKPNFIDSDPGKGEGRGGYALFVGRLTQEKGINTLLAAWEKIDGKIPLKIVGDGSLAAQLGEASKRISGVEWLGLQTREQVLDLMKDAMVFIFPSKSYETFGMTIVEAFSVGLPVIASNLGSMSSMIEHGHTGLHFRPGDSVDLAEKVVWAINHPKELARMRFEARQEYLAKYTAELNYKMLMNIYEKAIGRAKNN
ncbi:MAG TPA: glycosyltransferase family 4 protein [Desulfosporosinus sp.]|nr:glycosyltransferase family 4 protein [Desulfosporosinus sp.]